MLISHFSSSYIHSEGDINGQKGLSASEVNIIQPMKEIRMNLGSSSFLSLIKSEIKELANPKVTNIVVQCKSMIPQHFRIDRHLWNFKTLLWGTSKISVLSSYNMATVMASHKICISHKLKW